MNQALVSARRARGLTISEAAQQIGISHGMLAMMETKKRNGGDDTKIKIATFYEKSVQELFFTH